MEIVFLCEVQLCNPNFDYIIFTAFGKGDEWQGFFTIQKRGEARQEFVKGNTNIFAMPEHWARDVFGFQSLQRSYRHDFFDKQENWLLPLVKWGWE